MCQQSFAEEDEEMQANKKASVTKFLKKYGYWIGLAFSIAILITVITVAAVAKPVTPDDDFTPVDTPTISFTNPVTEMTTLKTYSNTALQYNSTLKLWQSHKAVDFAADEGTEVYAVMDGKVTEVTYNYLMGNIVKLDVGGGITVVYASLASDVPVKAGDQVTKGSVIGKVSNTAKSEANDGPHLHLEVLLDGELVDPALYLDLAEK